MSDLKDELMEVRGVGEATAETVIQIVQEYETPDTSDNVVKALDYLESGYPGYAEKYLRREVE